MSQDIHDSVGAIIIEGNKILLIDRADLPFGFACPAGHMEKGESPIQALTRELKEETNLDIISSKLIGDKILNHNPCNKGSSIHHWYIFYCKVKGNIIKNEESKSISWIDLSNLKNLELEYTWQYWLTELKYIK